MWTAQRDQSGAMPGHEPVWLAHHLVEFGTDASRVRRAERLLKEQRLALSAKDLRRNFGVEPGMGVGTRVSR